MQKGVLDRLMNHLWRGNVRELENVLIEAIVRAQGKVILLEEIEKILNPSNSENQVNYTSDSLPHVEKEHIEHILNSVDWNRSKAARVLGITLPTLRSKIQKYGISSS
jgi:two-component system response regulator AtoC